MRVVHTTVFSDGVNGGNPAPVFLDADLMTDAEMQAAAAELGQEAVFVLKPSREDCALRFRYFVPDHELSLCAHDTIGAVTVLVREGLLPGDRARIETGAGAVDVRWQKDENGILVMLDQFLPEFRQEVPEQAGLAAALRIPEQDLAVTEALPAECASTSRFKLMVPVKDRETLDSLKPDFEFLWKLCDDCGCSGFYVFAVDPEQAGTFYARQFPCRSGYDEDPATGIAAAALGAYAVKHRVFPAEEGWNRFRIYQGHAMGRPSLLVADILLEEKKISGVRVCGYAK